MKSQQLEQTIDQPFKISQQVSGKPLNIRTGFRASSFKHEQFDALMDPVVMMDHYTMTEPTFGAHPHAGMSAVSIIFEDSEGIFNNKDSLGNNIDLRPGDAYWLKAGAGAIHDEKPTPGSHTHGLQIFVNLPQASKYDAPAALHVPAARVPVIHGDGYRVRVVFGSSNGTEGATSPALPFTALDAFLGKGGRYRHAVLGEQSLLIYAVNREVDITIDEQTLSLPKGRAVAIQVLGGAHQLLLSSPESAHVVVLQGTPIKERFVQKGPFVMADLGELEDVSAAYQAGRFGSISNDG